MFRVELVGAEIEHWDYLRAKVAEGWTDEVSEKQFSVFKSLIQREAIPDHRRKRFFDPEYNPSGRSKSIHDHFQKNIRSGSDISRHPRFYRYLSYFISGPDIDMDVALKFASFVESLMKPITSGDDAPLRKRAREICREHGLSSGDRDRFFELALECQLPVSFARSIREAVSQVK